MADHVPYSSFCPLHGCVFEAIWNMVRFIHFMDVCLTPHGISQDSSTSWVGVWRHVEYRKIHPLHGCVFEAKWNIARFIHFNSWMCVHEVDESWDVPCGFTMLNISRFTHFSSWMCVRSHVKHRKIHPLQFVDVFETMWIITRLIHFSSWTWV